MTSERTETITVTKTILLDVFNRGNVVGQVTGRSRIDEHDRWIVELDLMEPAGNRGVNLSEGDEFDFAEGTWRVAKVYEPSTSPRGPVAELVRVSQPES